MKARSPVHVLTLSNQSTQWLLLPWLVEETVEMVGGLVLLVINIFKSPSW